MTDIGEEPLYPALAVHRREPDEQLTRGGDPLPLTLLDFWQWSNSDLISNVARGVLAEFLVASAVGAANRPRDPWADFDVLDPTGISIEVKSSAYIQAWSQTRRSDIKFKVKATRPVALGPDILDVPSRRAQLWVLALLHHDDQATLNPLDVSQWTFYVIPTWFFDARTRSQHSITLASLEACEFGERVSYERLAEAVRHVAALPVPLSDPSARFDS